MWRATSVPAPPSASHHPLPFREITMLKSIDSFVRNENRRSGVKRVITIAALLSTLSVHAIAANKAAILLPGSINDQSWNAQGFDGVKQLKADGWDVAYSENVQPA